MPVANQRNLRYVFASLFLFFLTPASLFATTPTWQGPYLGAFLGGGFGNDQMSTHVGNVTSSSYFASPNDLHATQNAGTSTKGPSSVIAGMTAGHDWVLNQMIYGVALDYGALPLSASNKTSSIYLDSLNQYTVHTSMQTNWLLTLRGRLAHQAPWSLPSIVYLTGGMAITKLKASNRFYDNSALAGAGHSDLSQDQIGWTVGAGIEIPALSHVTIDLEYLYLRIPSVNTTGTISNTADGFGIPARSMNSPFATTADFYANLFKIGVNYRFNE